MSSTPDDERRKKAATPLAELVPDLVRLVPQLTDEEWERRDAEVEAIRRADATLADGDRLAELLELGFPRRSVEIIRAGVGRAPAIERMSFLVRSREILVLSGPKGSGKTVAATWWASQRRDRVRFSRASSFAAESRYERVTREELFAGPLVLDDLGAEYVDAKGSFLTDLDELIDAFYGDMRALVVTTNCAREEFRARYGERIADRLRECGRWISLTGESLRKPSRPMAVVDEKRKAGA